MPVYGWAVMRYCRCALFKSGVEVLRNYFVDGSSINDLLEDHVIDEIQEVSKDKRTMCIIHSTSSDDGF